MLANPIYDCGWAHEKLIEQCERCIHNQALPNSKPPNQPNKLFPDLYGANCYYFKEIENDKS